MLSPSSSAATPGRKPTMTRCPRIISRRWRKHKADLKKLTDQARWKEAERREHHHDLTLLKRKVDYTSPQMQPPVYYDTLHKIYTAKAPFYYDGDNPYEYDFVLPWDYHKTNAILDQYKMEGEMMEKAENVGEGTTTARETSKEEYQFAGSPGANPFVTSSDMSNRSSEGVKSSHQHKTPQLSLLIRLVIAPTRSAQ
ncbi:hypothetical protein BSL78_22076 [Apostichopus japonicus]|uniref:Uncharacterized protein n=1 Tax=Stichopus japonicus TaxID=307972 RepID=A0A2G8JZ98_STIJA|nr:hypothetical protein BSL78_22076 [Apostichopus japonicus]